MIRLLSQLCLVACLPALGCVALKPTGAESASELRPTRVAGKIDIDEKDAEKKLAKNGDDKNGDDKKDDDDKKDKKDEKKRPEKVLEWCIGPKKDEDAPEHEPTRPQLKDTLWPRPLGWRKLFGWDEDDGTHKEDILPHDRPHFTDAATTVGLGRAMIEMGYTYVRDRNDGTAVDSHSYPETLLRLGLFAEWFELRILWNHGIERTTQFGQTETAIGSQDLLLGGRFAMTEQKGWLPETAITIEAFLPTGSRVFSANGVMPAIRWHYCWDVIEEWMALEGMTVLARAREDSGHDYLQVAQSGAVEFFLTPHVELFAELFAIMPHGAIDSPTRPQYYFNGGFTYLFTKNLGVDWRAGCGLNRAADDFFTGTGLMARY